ncbi:Zonadhesin [Mizuhopecten yessoensis]|uniref:Zonadhesin n=1 Tax=Mizuhopecten yessoensis TaxID=6573 RepID=A0A210Q5L7_MIZYE|nr:Zonadhesin [Mizuhopecten yessoensis]
MKVLCLLLAIVVTVRGHGRLWEPPSRSTMFRRGYATPPNYNDNQLNCGGFATQWGYPNKGKCGICGDPYNGKRKNEAGGRYATGMITRKYSEGQIIDLDVEVTANHMGWFEFRVCPNNNVKKAATQECLDQHKLQLADGSGTKYYITRAVGHFNMKYRLPFGLTCTQCVLQWKWHVANSWGTDPDGRSGIGNGPQEEFYGCSDVAIEGRSGAAVVGPVVTSNSYPKPTTTTPKPTTTTPKPTTTTSQPTTTTPKPTTTTPKPTITTPKPTITTPKPTTTTPKPTTTTPKPTTTTPKPTTTTTQPTTTTTTPKPTTKQYVATLTPKPNRATATIPSTTVLPVAAAQSSTCTDRYFLDNLKR